MNKIIREEKKQGLPLFNFFYTLKSHKMIFNSNLAIYTFNPADFKNDKRHTQNLFLLPIEQIGKTEVTQIKNELLNFYDMGGFC